MSVVRILFLGFVAGCVLFLWHLVGGYVISGLVDMPGFTPYRTLLEFILVPQGDLPVRQTRVLIAAHLALGLVLASAMEAPSLRQSRGFVVAVAAALVAAALVQVPQVGLVQFGENAGGLTHISKRYGFGAVLVSVSSVAAAAASVVLIGWVLQFARDQSSSGPPALPEP